MGLEMRIPLASMFPQLMIVWFDALEKLHIINLLHFYSAHHLVM